MSRVKKLNEILRRLQGGTPDLEASALVSVDGLMIARALHQDIDEERAAGICAVLLNLGGRTSKELARGKLKQVYVQGEEGYIVMTQATEETVLMVITNNQAKLGLIFLEIRDAISEIKKIIG